MNNNELPRAEELRSEIEAAVNDKNNASIERQRAGLIKQIRDRHELLLKKVKDDVNYNKVKETDCEITEFSLKPENKKYFENLGFKVVDIPGGPTAGQFHQKICW
jgi:hypothetical protein